MKPTLSIIECHPEKRDDGVILLTIGRATRAIRKTSEYEALIAIDRTGRIAWEREFDFCLMDVRRSQRDKILIMGTGGVACEIDLSGAILNKWYCKGLHKTAPDGILVDTLKFHHSICELESGHLCSLSIEQKQLKVPTEDADFVMLDTVLVWDRDGTVISEFSLDGVCDTERFGHDHFTIYYENQGWPRTSDWSHGNCVIQDPRDGGFLLSFRHQDSITKISATGELMWILGVDQGYRPEFRDKLLRPTWERPFFHQHDISFTQSGDLMIFDNGTTGSFPPDPRQPLDEQESFAVAFRIDEKAMTATETWRYGGEGELPFSVYVSGVCETPNGNRFIACTGLKHDLDGNRVELPPHGRGSIELIEVDQSGRRTFHARIEAPNDPVEKGWNGFRPEYLPLDLASRLGQA